ncbi:hypothetical protein GCM10023328_41390 [Modestobacter marinus]|uniref:VanZ family protein n=1 Tax=Modestobacter marinus TaxID=477641 RepID=A0A846LYQ3_9ACTN|nr:VanZ family protein [Modestobacter marinus]NIH68559.1 VanZ family protein [Modestobacter marinus]GGL58208.1 hypothetical protein GCM10011589_12800 [Modestobacter marinus]
MTPTHHPTRLRDRRAPGTPRPGRLGLATVAVLLAVGWATLGPAWLVADARRAVVAGVEVLAAPWPGSVHRAEIEALANVLLFVPVGALAALFLRRCGPVLPVALGAAGSVLVELVQSALPGRVPDVVDVAANTTGTVAGVALTAVALAALRRPGRARARRLRRGLLLLLVAAPLLVGVAGCSSSRPVAAAGPPDRVDTGTRAGGAVTVADGYVADGEELSAFADVPAVTGLDGALRTAVQDAARDATADGVDFHVSSGWRSAAYQQSLFDAAVAQYGSAEAARQWVLTPEESSHVTGDAVDIGPTDAMSWLAQHGSDYGLCQTYGNEMWHFELAVERGGQCPAPAADPTAG